jgi:hypothetical protein
MGIMGGGDYPFLHAEQTDETAREMLRAVARGRGVLVVQLLAAPVVEGLHVLEVAEPGRAPERFFAEPVAAPCDLGFPLRLGLYSGATTTAAPPQPTPPDLFDVPASSRAPARLSAVPDLAFDSLPPRRTDSPTSAPAAAFEVPQSGVDLGGWLMTGSGSMQAITERVIDQAWLAELTMLVDVESFKEETVALLGPVAKLLRHGDAQTLSAVVTTMRSVIKQDNGVGRAKFAGRVLRFLRDPTRLVALVDAALGSSEEISAPLKHVLVETQAAGAEALVAGRSRHRGEPARRRFVALVRAIGPAATASVGAALRGCLERGERTGDLVEDLLRAIPAAADEATGAVIVELLRGGPVATTTTAALGALTVVWGERARPALLSALNHPDQGVVLAAVNGLRHLGAIDLSVVRRLEPIVTGVTPAAEQLRLAATAAIAGALPDARPDAATIAARAFGSSRQSWTAAPTIPPSAAVTVAQAHALLALGVANAAATIEARAEHSPPDVRMTLLSLVRRG